MKKILCIDGGGVRGKYAAYVIMRLEETYNIKFSEYFDEFYGVSSGSLIVAMLSLGYNGKEIFEKYNVNLKNIFSNKNRLLELINETFLNKKILENKNLNVFVYNYSKSRAEIINIKGKEDNLYLYASCAAPIIFEKVKIKNDLYIDGSILTRSPSIYAFNNEISKGNKIDDMKLLSLGCIQGNLEFSNIEKSVNEIYKNKEEETKNEGISNKMMYMVSQFKHYISKKITSELPIDKLIELEKTFYHSIDSSIDINDELLKNIFNDETKYIRQDFKTQQIINMIELSDKLFSESVDDFESCLKNGKFDKFFIQEKKNIFKRIIRFFLGSSKNG